jgi:CheY-like chemotaxis protein
MNATTHRRPRALLLDDDPVVLRLVGTALETRGFDVRAATDGQHGVAMLLDELLDLDVLVTDVDLPARDAWSLLHLVRRAGGERDLGFVVLAGGEPPVHEQLLALGADAVVDRADGPGAVVAAVDAVARARARAAAYPFDAASPAARGALLPAARSANAPQPRALAA